MDVDFFASRVHSAKHSPFVHAARHNNRHEEESSDDEEFSKMDRTRLELEKVVEKIRQRRLQLSKVTSSEFSKDKLDLSISNLSTNLPGSLTLKHTQESEEKSLANVGNFKFEDECDDGDYYEVTENQHGFSKDGDDDARAYVACPLCDMDIEGFALYSHLQEDHGFELKNAVCPLCAANLGKDVIGHFLTRHTSSLKYRRKAQKSGTWTGTSAMLGKELSSFLGSSTNGRGNALESAPDPLLSPFFGGVSHLDHKETEQNEFSRYSATLASHSQRNEIYSASVNNKVDREERRQRVAFVQQLIASTIF